MSICIEVGGLPIQLETDDASFEHDLVDRYLGFSRYGEADARLDITLIHSDDLDSDSDVAVTRQGETWRITRGDFECEWNSLRRKGWVRQSANPYSIDAALRIIHTLELVRQGGFLLHSSSVVRNGRAFLFTGVSEAGKTTISRLMPSDAILLTDEISYVKPEGGVYRAYGTPFAGDLGRPGDNISAPIGEVYLLAKGPENVIQDVTQTVAVRSLLRNILFFAHDPLHTAKLLDIAGEFVSKVPVQRLTFFPDQRVWELIQ